MRVWGNPRRTRSGRGGRWRYCIVRNWCRGRSSRGRCFHNRRHGGGYGGRGRGRVRLRAQRSQRRAPIKPTPLALRSRCTPRLDPRENSARIAARVGCATCTSPSRPLRTHVQPWPPLPNPSCSLASLSMNSCALSGSDRWMRRSKKHRTTAILPFRSRESRRS